MKRVAVESNLSPVQEYLSNQGYQVETLDVNSLTQSGQQQYDAVVISGMDQNLMGIADVQVAAPVINADGLTPEEVANRIESLNKRH